MSIYLTIVVMTILSLRGDNTHFVIGMGAATGIVVETFIYVSRGIQRLLHGGAGWICRRRKDPDEFAPKIKLNGSKEI